MRIFLFSTGFNDFIIELANSLSSNSEVILVLPSDTIRTKEYVSNLSNSVTFEPIRLPRLRDLFSNIRLMKYVLKLIKKHDPDVIHIQSHGHLFFGLIFPFIKSPVVNTIHDAKPHYGDLHTKSSRIAPFFGNYFSRHFIVHSEFTKQQLIDNGGHSSNKISVVPLSNPFLSENIKKNKNNTKKRVLFMGRIWRYKGLHVLINAEPYISNYLSDYCITIAGVGEDIRKYKKIMVNRNKFEILNERLPFTKLMEVVSSCDVVVLPYLEATQSGIVNLAYSFGKPIICTNVGGLPEQVRDNETGMVVPPNDPKKLATSIVTILKNPKIAKRFGNNGKNRVLSQSSGENVANKTLNIYKELVKDEA